MKMLSEVRAYLIWSLTPMLLLTVAELHRRAVTGPHGAVVALGLTLVLALTLAAWWLRLRADQRDKERARQALAERLAEIERHIAPAPEMLKPWPRVIQIERYGAGETAQWWTQQDDVALKRLLEGSDDERLNAIRKVLMQQHALNPWQSLLEPLKLYAELLKDFSQDLAERKEMRETRH
jgi:hypothetical protein